MSQLKEHYGLTHLLQGPYPMSDEYNAGGCWDSGAAPNVPEGPIARIQKNLIARGGNNPIFPEQAKEKGLYFQDYMHCGPPADPGPFDSGYEMECTTQNVYGIGCSNPKCKCDSCQGMCKCDQTGKQLPGSALMAENVVQRKGAPVQKLPTKEGFVGGLVGDIVGGTVGTLINIAIIALVIYLVYTNWDKIRGWFGRSNNVNTTSYGELTSPELATLALEDFGLF